LFVCCGIPTSQAHTVCSYTTLKITTLENSIKLPLNCSAV